MSPSAVARWVALWVGMTALGLPRPASAQQVTINFDDATGTPVTYTNSGITFEGRSWDGVSTYDLSHLHVSAGGTGGNYVWWHNGASNYMVAQSGGARFAVESLVGVDRQVTVTLKGFKSTTLPHPTATGDYSTTLTSGGGNQTFNINWPDVQSIAFLIVDAGNYGIDSFVFNQCTDTDGDGVSVYAACGTIDNCPGVSNASQTDTDGDASGDACDGDDDNDGILDLNDEDPTDNSVCRDVDGDDCDDCAIGDDHYGSDPDYDPDNDGLDTDGDGACDTGDAGSPYGGDDDDDDDNDGVNDGPGAGLDTANTNRFVCKDSDGDSCNDCADFSGDLTGEEFPWSATFDIDDDGLDTDGDGLCNASGANGDQDDDNDGVVDGSDTSALNRNVCGDVDADGCDDCADYTGDNDPWTETYDVDDDGYDFDADGLCDTGDPDDDDDGALDGVDDEDNDRAACRDSDLDTCDDCYDWAQSHESGATFHPEADGPDFDEDGHCDDGDTCTDTDEDGYGNPGFAANECDLDNCPSVFNDDQDDLDDDGAGDACDTCTDQDEDGWGDPGSSLNISACPETGGNCTGAGDPDCVPYADNCPTTENDDQSDIDEDGAGDLCDGCSDPDGDHYGTAPLAITACTGSTSVWDNCPDDANATQADLDDDDDGDACDTCTDDDDDGWGNPGFAATTCPLDNCPALANASQANLDGDATGDVCDTCTDDDGDGYADPTFQNSGCAGTGFDNCPSVANATQSDLDGDLAGDACDLDDDGDGLSDAAETAIGLNPLDTDSDDDTILDTDEVSNPAAPEDTDGDLTIDALDTDSDQDGVSDAAEAGDTNPDTPPVDTDGDGTEDFRDTESDGDGVMDVDDNCRDLANPSQDDLDEDHEGDDCDDDDDGDLVADLSDNCARVENADQEDMDDDGEGDACEGHVEYVRGGSCLAGSTLGAAGVGSWPLLALVGILARRRRSGAA